MQDDAPSTGKLSPNLPKVSVYFVAGISTWKSGDMFGPAMKHIKERYRNNGWNCSHTEALYPYGTMDDIPREQLKPTIRKQMWHVFQDMYQPAERSPRAAYLSRIIRKHYGSSGEGEILLIGHSGGGIAAYLAARMLRKQGYPVRHVVQVGSPGGYIHAEWRDDVYCLRESGDVVTWWRLPFIGSASRRDVVQIEGGHPLYFCDQTKDKDGCDNLTKVMDKIWGRLYENEEVAPVAAWEPDISQG
ncbi:esterase/lipase family protein [Paenibacillus senegalensis]|uniref:esterase/lipase family protein n=1 Tax=Paenibacillus senegalensis TaxID=1465766 RepID=UPI000289357B|nr:alpha/beta hydrolase [Paenibacillus senegalensis]